MQTNTATLLTALTGFLAVEATAPGVRPRGPVLDRRWWLSDEIVRGVNLGSQFIIEEWFAKDEWRDMGCEGVYDEWSCVEMLGQEAADAAFDWHWDTWINEDDMSKIASLGLNTVRIPIGFWINEGLVHDDEYYPRGGLAYLDRLVGWAADYGLYVIIDLHGGPGSQAINEEYTGHGVDDPQFYTEANFERAYQWLEWMTERMHTNDNYRTAGSIQVINEPLMERVNDTAAAYLIENYYPNAQQRIRAREDELGIADEDRLHIQYMSENWGSGDPTTYLNDTTWVFFDDHVYHLWDTTITQTKEGYISASCAEDRGGGHSIVVGEWSIDVGNDAAETDEFSIKDRPEQAGWYRDYFNAQAYSYEKNAGGWIFWTWKCNWMNGYADYRWCYEFGVDAGAIPDDASAAAGEAPC